MLAKIREKTQSIFAIFLLVLFLIPFALWGTYSYFESVSREAVAEVNGMEIGLQAYRQALEQLRDPRNPRLLEDPAIKQLVVEGLIDQVLLVQAARDSGYRIGDERLARSIRELPYFQRNGRFDQKLYEELLRREGIGVQEFESRHRGEQIAAQVRDGLVESAVVTEDDLQSVIRLLRQQREVAQVLISVERFLAGLPVTAKEIEQYYRDNSERFRVPEEVRIEYLQLSVPKLASGLTIEENELRRAYEQEADRYVIPEQRHAAHILAMLSEQATAQDVEKARARIEALARRARAGEDFGVLARKHSDDADSAGRGGDLGTIRRGILPPELEAIVYALKPGEISGPVRTAYGYHLVKLIDYTPERRRPFEAVRKEIEQRLRRRKAEERFYESVEQLRNLAYEQPDSLEPAARALGLKIERSQWFTRAGGQGLEMHPRVVEAAFHPEVLEERRNSDVIELDADTALVLRVTDHRPARLEPLEAVRARIERELRRRKAEEAARALGERLLAQLEQGAAFAAMAKKHGLVYQPPRLFTRETPGLDPRLLEAVFRAPRPAPGRTAYGGVLLGEKGYVLYALSRVIEPDPAKADTTARERARRLLLSRRGAEYYSYYRLRLRQLAEVEIYKDRL